MFFSITKSFTSGHLAGITLTEVLPFAMPVGNYESFLGTCAFDVTDCREVGA